MGKEVGGGIILDIQRIRNLVEYKAKKQSARVKKNRYEPVRLSNMSREAVRQSAIACKDQNN